VQRGRRVGGASDSMHLYGAAADLRCSEVTFRTIYQKAETCGFPGLETFHIGHQHVDSRANLGRTWWCPPLPADLGETDTV
jgi:hypothetical protein